MAALVVGMPGSDEEVCEGRQVGNLSYALPPKLEIRE